MNYKRMLYEKVEPSIVKVTMNRPEKRNAEDALMLEEMQEAFVEADIDEVMPELKARTLWKLRSAGVYEIAESPGAVGVHRPSLQPPGVANLYLVSHAVREARGESNAVGTPAVAAAALRCVDLILGNQT